MKRSWQDATRPPPGEVGGCRARLGRDLRSLPGRIRGTEYVRVGESRRFRAAERRRMWVATRIAMLVIVGAYVFDMVTTLGRGQAVVAIDGGLIAVALAGWWSLAHRGRRRPELVATIVGCGVFLTMVATAVAVPDLAIQSTGYLLLLPGLVALLLPWRTRTHLVWLGAYVVAAVAFLSLVDDAILSAHARGDLMTVVALASATSLVGQVALKRARVRAFAELERNRALRRQSNAYVGELIGTTRALRTLEATAERFERQALHDPLTGLANRALLDDRLEQALAQRDELVAVVILDLDDFKSVNDRLGHDAGDEVLRVVAERFGSVLRTGDTLARLGGDEFAVVAPGVHDAAMACEITDRLLESLHLPIQLAGSEGAQIIVHASAGIDIGTAGASKAHELRTHADAALYLAKGRGKNRWELFAARVRPTDLEPER